MSADVEVTLGFRAAAAGLLLQIACGEAEVSVLPWLLQLLSSREAFEGLAELRAACAALGGVSVASDCCSEVEGTTETDRDTSPKQTETAGSTRLLQV